jgi:hypothetical protein
MARSGLLGHGSNLCVTLFVHPFYGLETEWGTMHKSGEMREAVVLCSWANKEGEEMGGSDRRLQSKWCLGSRK